MTIQRGKDLLNQSDTNANELRKAILSLRQEKKYVENCIDLEFRDQVSGQKVVDEISDMITQLEEKLESRES
jgi:hypothetical protein